MNVIFLSTFPITIASKHDHRELQSKVFFHEISKAPTLVVTSVSCENYSALLVLKTILLLLSVTWRALRDTISFLELQLIVWKSLFFNFFYFGTCTSQIYICICFSIYIFCCLSHKKNALRLHSCTLGSD